MITSNAQLPTRLALIDPEKIPIASQILVLFGPTSELHPLVLQSLFLRTQRGERIGLIAGDNHLDGYALARVARAYGFDPAVILTQIDFSRPFTCHQLHHGVVDLVMDKVEDWHALYVLGLLETFYDEDIPLPLVARLLDDILLQLRCIADGGVPVLITLAPSPSETARTELMTRVIHAADALARL